MLVVNENISIPRSELPSSSCAAADRVAKMLTKSAVKRSCPFHLLHLRVYLRVSAGVYSRSTTRFNKEGELLISSERYRDRQRNIEDCLISFGRCCCARPSFPNDAERPSLRGAAKNDVCVPIANRPKKNRDVEALTNGPSRTGVEVMEGTLGIRKQLLIVRGFDIFAHQFDVEIAFITRTAKRTDHVG